MNSPEFETVVSSACDTTSAMWRLTQSPQNPRRRAHVRGFDVESSSSLFGMPSPPRPRSGRPPTPPPTQAGARRAAVAGIPLLRHLPASVHARASTKASDVLGNSSSLPLLKRGCMEGWVGWEGGSDVQGGKTSLDLQLERAKSNLALGEQSSSKGGRSVRARLKGGAECEDRLDARRMTSCGVGACGVWDFSCVAQV